MPCDGPPAVKPRPYDIDTPGLRAYWPLTNARDPRSDLAGAVPAGSHVLEVVLGASASPGELSPTVPGDLRELPHAAVPIDLRELLRAAVPPPWAGPDTERAWFRPGHFALRTLCRPEYGRQFFTWEAWVRWPDRPSQAQTLFEAVTEKGTAWRLWLDDSIRLTFEWTDDAGESAVIKSAQLVDLLPEAWYHVAVAFVNECSLGQPYAEHYSRAEVYFTPAGELFPWSVALMRGGRVRQVRSGPTQVYFGRRPDGTETMTGTMAGIAWTGRAKLKNEFATLGQRPPENIRVSGDFPQGSAFSLVARGPHAFTVGLKPHQEVGNYWFYGRFEVPVGRELDFEVVPVPGGESMLVAAWWSADEKTWTRIPGGFYDQTSRSGSVFRFRASFPVSPVYLACSIPYTYAMLQNLIETVGGDPRVEVHVPAHSVDGRPIPLLCVTDPEVPLERKRAVYMQAGQHSPGEMIGAHALEAAIRSLLVPSERNRRRLRDIAYLFVPIVNVDCAVHGSRAHNENGVNLNRNWLEPTEPETKGLRAFIDRWIASGRRLDLALDFHAGGVWVNHAVLVPTKEVMAACGRAEVFEPQERFLDFMDRRMEYKRRDVVYQRSRPHPAMFASVMLEVYGVPCPTMEMSFMSYRSLDGKSCHPVDHDHVVRLGVQLLEALDGFFGIDGAEGG